MDEAVIHTAADGTILFCNARFSDYVGRPLERIFGHYLVDLVPPSERDSLKELLRACRVGPVKQRVAFLADDGAVRPTLLSGRSITQYDEVRLCLVAADLSELENSARQIEHLQQVQAELKESRLIALRMMEDAQEARRRADETAAALRYSQQRLELGTRVGGLALIEIDYRAGTVISRTRRLGCLALARKHVALLARNCMKYSIPRTTRSS